jgi:hypothetical protein
MGRGDDLKSPFVRNAIQVISRCAPSPTSVGFMARASPSSGCRARQKPPSSLTRETGSPTDGFRRVKDENVLNERTGKTGLARERDRPLAPTGLDGLEQVAPRAAHRQRLESFLHRSGMPAYAPVTPFGSTPLTSRNIPRLGRNGRASRNEKDPTQAMGIFHPRPLDPPERVLKSCHYRNGRFLERSKKEIRLVASCGLLPRSPSHPPPHRRIAKHRVRFAAAFSPFYHPVKVVPAHPGRRRSTALAQP